MFQSDRIRFHFNTSETSVIRKGLATILETIRSLFKFAHTKNQVTALLVLVLLSTSTVLPSFAALNSGISAFSSHDINTGEERFIPYEDPEVLDLLANENVVISADDGVLSNPTVTDHSGSVFTDKQVENYTVNEGDTLATIAKAHNITVDTIKFNNGLDKDALKAGQKLNIMPQDGILVRMTETATVESLAREYGVDIEALAEGNDVSVRAEFKSGEIVMVPGNDQVAKAKTRIEEENKLLAEESKKTEAQKIKMTTIVGKKSSTIVTGKTGKKGPGVIATKSGSKIAWPASNPVLTQGYHYGHPGIDIAYTKGDHTTAIVSVLAGTVIKASGGWNGGYGNMVLVDHGNGMVTRYAHLREIYVTTGQKVSRGQSVGWMGKTGNVRGRTGLHLHFEVIIGGRKVNPMSYL